MSFDLILNELSIREPADDLFIARDRMREFLLTVRAATVLGANHTIRSVIDPNMLPLGPGYPISRWRNDSEVDMDLRRFFRTLISKVPVHIDIPELLRELEVNAFEFRGKNCPGLAAAFILDSIAISFRSSEEWDTNLIRIAMLAPNETTGELDMSAIQLLHACTAQHIDSHTAWIQERTRASITDGSELVERRGELLPGIDFCRDVLSKLQELNGGDVMLGPVVKKLLAFQRYVASWESGPFDSNSLPMRITGESEQTLAQFAQERTIVCPDGRARLFELHARLTPLAWRIHFVPLERERRILIGYVGPHLHTARFRT